MPARSGLAPLDAMLAQVRALEDEAQTVGLSWRKQKRLADLRARIEAARTRETG